MIAAEDMTDKYPIHCLVWQNSIEELNRFLSENSADVEVVDPRGRTPLHLAVTLGHLECVRALLRHGANATVENDQNWTVLQEAVATGDPEIVQVCLQHRDLQQFMQRASSVPRLLQRLTESPDFYVEMRWEFASWVPFVSRICPSDTYRVWKCGSKVRIDTTLLGFDNMQWRRGNRSYVFKGQGNDAMFLEMDHDNHQICSETITVPAVNADASFSLPSEDAVAARLTSPIVTTYVDTENIMFERSKSGFWGWRNDKSEIVNGYSCKVFSASNVQLITKTRSEHLTEQDKKRSRKPIRGPLDSFWSVAEQEHAFTGAATNGELSSTFRNPCHITMDDYFNADVDLSGRDIGRPIEQSTKTQRFRAQISLCENHPVSLPEQILPIIDLMAESNAHFRKLKDFITLQLPSGFPVKIEIPLFHAVNAKISFGNIFAMDSPKTGVTCVRDGESYACAVDESVFDAPSTYSVIGDLHHNRLRDEDDEVLQFAIQQSLLEGGSENDQVTLWEALNKSKRRDDLGAVQSEDEQLLQQVLADSMGLDTRHASSTPTPSDERNDDEDDDENYRMALELSQQEQQEIERRQREEEEQLQKILELSLIEK